MIKKKYIQPIVDVVEIGTKMALMQGSLTLYTNSNDAVESNAVLSRSHNSIWDDEEEF